MNRATPSTPRLLVLQCNLRALLVVVIICALLAANYRWTYQCATWLVVRLFFAASALALALYALIGRRAAIEYPELLNAASRRPIIRGVLVFALLLLVFALITRHRWYAIASDPAWPRPWPYPDSVISSMNAWLDARNPPPPGTFKLFGEFHTVLLLVDFCGVLASAVVGFCQGVLTTPR